MTGRQFRQLHGDPATWTDDEYEQFAQYATPGDPAPARELLARLAQQQPATRDCWFCSAPNPTTATRCGFCSHHTDDNPAA